MPTAGRPELNLPELFLPPGGTGRLFASVISDAANRIVRDLAGAGAFPPSAAPVGTRSSHLSDILADGYVPSVEAMLALGEEAVHGCVPVSSPFVAAHLHCPPLVAAVVAEVYIAAMNQSMDSFDQSPTATGWEMEVIAHLLDLAGLPKNGAGVFTTGGTESNLMALMAARATRDGTDSGYVLCSDQAHFSIAQAARVLGMAPEDVVPIPSTRGRIDPAWVSQYIADRAGMDASPLAIVATAGTTSLGVIDPLAELVDIARAAGAWIHVDGAYGCGLLFSSSPPAWTAHLQAVDSFSVDFHKMLMQPISCAAFLVAQENSLDIFSNRAQYLNREEDEDQGYINLVSRSLKTTRRFDALKLVFTLAGIGRTGLAAIVDALHVITVQATDLVRHSVLLDLYCEPDVTTIAFGPAQLLGLTPAEQANLVTSVRHHLLKAARAVVGEIHQDGRSWWKLTFVNPVGTHADLRELFDRIEAALRAELHLR